MEETRKGWVPFFKEGMDPRAIHQEYRKKILDLLIKSEKPLNPSKIAEILGMAGVTASKTCFELSCEGKLKYFVIGGIKCFAINLDSVTEIVNSSKLEVRK